LLYVFVFEFLYLFQYCNENVFPELKLFVDRNGRIPCPIKECDGCFDEVVAMNRFNPHSRIRYCNLIEEKLVPLYSSIKLLSNSLRDLLTLSCPHCHLAVGNLSLFTLSPSN